MQGYVTKLLAGAAAAAGLAGAAGADTIRATSGFGPAHVLATDAYPLIFQKLEEFTDGAWTGQDTPSGLVAPNEMNAALRDGVSELGAVVLPYFAADFPESMLPSELSIFGTNNLAISSAVTEYIVTCPECLEEFSRAGQVYLGSDSTTPYNFLSTTPMQSVGEVQGKRIRTGSPVYSNFVESIGGVPVQMAANELFEGLSQGVLDATFSSTSELINARLVDVVTHVTDLELGVFNSAAVNNASALLWQRMEPEARAALARAAQYGISDALFAWQETTERAREEGEAAGIAFVEPDASLTDAAASFREKHRDAAVGILEGRGVTDAAEKVARYQELVDKWHGLVEGVTNPEELAELRYREIWSDVDFAAYGQ
jgi:TRAP-type transport system periplasmic protein